MTIKSVGFQLKTDGKAQVKNDFAELRTAGTSAFVGVADAAEAASVRAGRANDDFTARQIEGFRKAATAAKLAAAAANDRSMVDAALAVRGNGSQFATVNLDRSTGAAKAAADVFRPLIEAEEQMEARTRALITAIDPAWAAQQRYNSSMREARELLDLGRISAEQYGLAQTRAQAQLDVGTGATKRAEIAAAALSTMQARVSAAGDNGFGGWAGSAERSSSAFRQLIADEEQLERRVNALRMAIDPAVGAQQRFDAEMAEARSLISQGAISLDEYVGKLRIEQDALDQVTGSRSRLNGVNGHARQSSIMLGQQLQDFSVQVSNGGSVATAFSQQIGQAAFAVQGMGGSLEKVGNFLTTPWGIAATIGVTVLAPLVAKILDGNDALEDAIDKLKKDAAASDVSRDAKLRYSRSVDGVAAAIREGTEATRKSIEAQKSAAEQDNISAKRTLEREIGIRKVTAALLDRAIAEANADKTRAQGPGQRGELGALSAVETGNRVAGLQTQLATQQAAIAAAEARVNQTRIALATEAANRTVDPMARIKKTYDDQVVAAQNKARAEGTVTTELTRQLAQIQRNRDAAVKAEQDRQSAANAKPTNQIGRNISLAESRDIVEGIGGRVTSDHRTFEEQQRLYAKYVAYKSGNGPWAALAAKPGTSNHELDQALDVAKSGGVTLAKLIAAYRQAGVKLVEALDEGDHYHVAWKKTGTAAREATQERTDAAKRVREAAAAERELKQDLEGVVKAYDPARAAADDYAAALARIQTLVGKGKLTIDDAAAYSATARIQFLTGQSERFATQFKTLFGDADPLKEIIEGSDRERAQRLEALTDADATRTKMLAANLDEVRGYGVSFVETVLSEDTWSSWGNAGKTVLNSLKSEFIKLALLNPLKNLISGNNNLPTLTSALGNIAGLFGAKPAVTVPRTIGPPGNATGTESFSGGLTYVNENGGELMDLPNGTRIYPAAETRRMLAANDVGSRPAPNVIIHANDSVLADTVRGWVAEGIAVASAQGAAGGARMSAANSAKRSRRRLPGN